MLRHCETPEARIYPLEPARAYRGDRAAESDPTVFNEAGIRSRIAAVSYRGIAMSSEATLSQSPHSFLSLGLPVETFDGHRVGTIAALSDDCFLTRRRHHEDFWLPDVFIRSVDTTRVRLQVDEHALRRYTPRERSIRRLLTVVAMFAVSALTTMLGFGL
jgi:hypothetical protein